MFIYESPKAMKNISYLFILLGFATTRSMGQTNVTESLSLSGVETVEVDCEWADIILQPWSNNDVKVEGMVLINNGENDDAFQLDIRKKGKSILVKSDIKDMDKLPKYFQIMKGNQKYHFRLNDDDEPDWTEVQKVTGSGKPRWTNKSVLVDIKLTIYIPSNVSLDVESTYGDVQVLKCTNALNVLNTYGHVIATFPSSQFVSDCDLTSTYSFVDVGITPSANIDLSMHTSYGDIYSDVDFDYNKSECINESFDNKIVGALNAGGPHLKIKATYSNIYLRKI